MNYNMVESTTIWVTKHVKNQIDAIKKRNEHQTYDSLLRHLIAVEKGIPCKGEKCVGYWNCIEYGCPKFKEKTEAT